MSTPQHVKHAFAKYGLSIRDWAVQNGFSEQLVYAVLNGRNQASRGESFRIAVALGLKEAPDTGDAPNYLRPMLEKPVVADATTS